jgi:hypothetical protein
LNNVTHNTQAPLYAVLESSDRTQVAANARSDILVTLANKREREASYQHGRFLRGDGHLSRRATMMMTKQRRRRGKQW